MWRVFEQASIWIDGEGGVPIHVRTWGSPQSAPLVLLHGAFESSDLFLRFPDISEVTLRRYVLMPDLRGHGASGKPLAGDAYAMTSFAGDLQAVLSLAHTRPVTLYAASRLATIICGAYVHRYGPSRLAEILLKDAPSSINDEATPVAALAVRDADLAYENLLHYLGRRPFETQQDYWEAVAAARLVPPVVARMLSYLLDRDLPNDWPLATHRLAASASWQDLVAIREPHPSACHASSHPTPEVERKSS